MEKNSVWAVALSTVVIIVWCLVVPIFFPSLTPAFLKRATNVEAQAEESTEPQELNISANSESETVIAESNLTTENSSNDEGLKEENFTITTDKVEVIFTNKGGDIISYKLLDHKDKDTNDFVQISDNVNANNRTCAIAFGQVDEKIIDEIFNTEIEDKKITFTKTLNVNGKKTTLRKVYTFMDGEYVFKLDVLVHTADSTGLDINGTSYTLRTSPQIGPHFNPKQNRYETRDFIAFNGSKTKKVHLVSRENNKSYDKDFIWSGIAGKYFIELVIPSSIETINKAYYASNVEVGDYLNAQAKYERKAFSGSDIQDSYYMYFGPRNEKELKRYNVSDKNGWGLSGYRVNQALQTYDFLKWLENILKFFLEQLYKLVHNWGVAIIIMTILLKVVLFPISKKQSLSSLKMQELQPKMKALQDKYKNDQQKLNQEMAKLYQQAGYNPASGCLPMVFQFLILFAMYDLFNNYFEFRGAMFIPRWIPDLSSGDSVFSWEKEIPVISGFTANHLRILPVIYVITQLLTSKITQYGQPAGQNQTTMKYMMYFMPFMFFFMFYNAPAGLLLYWLTSNILQIFQQLLINKMMKEKRAEKTASNAKVQKTLPPKGKRK